MFWYFLTVRRVGPYLHMCMRTQLLSRVWLLTTSWPVAHQAPLSLGFPRQEYWSGLPFPSPGDLPTPGIEPASLASPVLAGRLFTSAPLGNPLAPWPGINPEPLALEGGLNYWTAREVPTSLGLHSVSLHEVSLISLNGLGLHSVMESNWILMYLLWALPLCVLPGSESFVCLINSKPQQAWDHFLYD